MARKKLIEVALPLEKINEESAREKSIRHGHPSTLHLWWARRPLAACRAVIFTSLVDDPEHPEAPKAYLAEIDRLPRPEKRPDGRRNRLYDFIEKLVLWENSNNEDLLATARKLIVASTDGNPPPLLDPFCGGGSIPLEGQRLGLEVHASDLNPVAVLITKALVEIPPKFAGRPPVNPGAASGGTGGGAAWRGAAGLAADVRHYGRWMRDEAFKRIGHLYPKAKLPDGGEATVIAWLWARTVASPNPAAKGAMTPLVRTFWLSTKKNRETWLETDIDQAAGTVTFNVKTGTPTDRRLVDAGTKLARGAKFADLFGGQAIPDDHIKKEGMADRLGSQLIAVVAEGQRERIYLPAVAAPVPAASAPDPGGVGAEIADDPRNIWCKQYGLTTFADLFTPRQLVALTTFSDLVGEARERVLADARAAGMADDGVGIADGGVGATAYADAVATYLAFALDKMADRNSSLSTWFPSRDSTYHTFARQALPMAWDFAETNVMLEGTGSYVGAVDWTAECLGEHTGTATATIVQADIGSLSVKGPMAVATDPPYYDNIGYADLSDFFYVWLRRSLGRIYPSLFATVLTPKARELIASPYRHGGSASRAEEFFRLGLSDAFHRVLQTSSPDIPTTIFYAFKQSETQPGDEGRASTGWDSMLSSLVSAGFQVTGTWPMRTELANRMIGAGTNALASSVVLVCVRRPGGAPIATRREFLQALRSELPRGLADLVGGGVAPVDLAQSVVGPGMAVFSRYSKVIEADGRPMTVRTALGLINQAVEDYFSEHEGDLDADSQFCVRWLEHAGFEAKDYGDAMNIAQAKNIAVESLAKDGILDARAGKVQLKGFEHYLARWETYDPAGDARLSTWEACHYLAAALSAGGEQSAARLHRRLGGLAEPARDLAYRLYTICEKKGLSEPGQFYNRLVAEWPEIRKASADLAQETQGGLGV